uniref:Telomeric repeat binding factor a n=1 Tax=Astyanax mexicanus TaxID=7994 RepID=A0A3B1IL23_ASTMX
PPNSKQNMEHHNDERGPKMASQLRETRVNYWVFEFYISKAFEAFRNEEYDSYVQFRNLVQGECCVVTLDVIIKLRFMQFLSQINDGDKPDITFQSSLTPLESALTTLENICSEIDVSQSVLEQVHTSIREMVRLSAGPLSSTVLVQLSLSMLRAVFLDLAELLPVSAPFSLVQEEVDREAVEQESGIDLDSDELILRLSETPVDLLLRETEESRRAGGERVLDADQPEQQGQENPVDLTLTENVLEKSGCYNGSGLTPHQIRGAASADPENANTNQNAKKHPGAAGSVTVAQLVMEEDSQTSEFETVDSQLTPSPLTAGHSEDDLLNSLPTNSMPVRKNRRPASSR